jgi:chromosome segregation ATPase
MGVPRGEYEAVKVAMGVKERECEAMRERVDAMGKQVEEARREAEGVREKYQQSIDEKITMQTYIMKKEDEIVSLRNELKDAISNQQIQ